MLLWSAKIINESLVSHWFFTGLYLKGLGKILEFIILILLLDLCSLALFKVTLINICKDSSADVFSKHLLQKHYKYINQINAIGDARQKVLSFYHILRHLTNSA